MKYQNVNMFRITSICLTVLFLGLMSASITHAETYSFVNKMLNTTVTIEKSPDNYHGKPAVHQKMTIDYSSTDSAVCDIYYNKSEKSMLGGMVNLTAFGQTMTQPFTSSDLLYLENVFIDIMSTDENTNTDTMSTDENTDTDTMSTDENTDTDTMSTDENTNTDTMSTNEDTDIDTMSTNEDTDTDTMSTSEDTE